jgi:sulfite dehydrogenase (cytochrome) subunit B
MTCHSADYIKVQPPRQGKAFWTAEVNKMIKVFGAPIEPGDAAKIIDYLVATY